MNLLKTILAICTFLLFLTACEEIRSYPDTPEISFKEFRYSDTVLIFTFADGDGDIGLNSADTLAPYNKGSQYYFNLFLTIFSKQNGKFEPLKLKDSTFYRIPRVPDPKPEDQDQVRRGDIQLNMSFLPAWPDTFALRFYMVDRSLHHSDTLFVENLTFKDYIGN
jgi:hypothetical protein